MLLLHRCTGYGSTRVQGENGEQGKQNLRRPARRRNYCSASQKRGSKSLLICCTLFLYRRVLFWTLTGAIWNQHHRCRRCIDGAPQRAALSRQTGHKTWEVLLSAWRPLTCSKGLRSWRRRDGFLAEVHVDVSSPSQHSSGGRDADRSCPPPRRAPPSLVPPRPLLTVSGGEGVVQALGLGRGCRRAIDDDDALAGEGLHAGGGGGALGAARAALQDGGQAVCGGAGGARWRQAGQLGARNAGPGAPPRCTCLNSSWSLNPSLSLSLKPSSHTHDAKIQTHRHAGADTGPLPPPHSHVPSLIESCKK